jgi:cellulose biosynthesis protein BcsQ
MKILTLSSWKGGTGKTTLAAAAIKTLAKQGKKILVIDLDSNLSMTRIFGLSGYAGNSIDLLNGDSVFSYCADDNIFLIPSDLRISRMSNLSDRVLKVALKKMDLKGFDYIFIDPPGTMNALTRNAICAADKVIIPAMPSLIDFEATSLVIEEMEMMGVEVDVSVILNGFNNKKNLQDIESKFSNEFEDLYFCQPVSDMKSLRNLCANISGYKLQGRAKQIIDSFVREVIE